MLMYFRIFLQELLCKLALRLYICSKYITIIIIVYRLHPGLPFSLFMKCLNNNVIYFILPLNKIKYPFTTGIENVKVTAMMK